jgi:hypothetical protein
MSFVDALFQILPFPILYVLWRIRNMAVLPFLRQRELARNGLSSSVSVAGWRPSQDKAHAAPGLLDLFIVSVVVAPLVLVAGVFAARWLLSVSLSSPAIDETTQIVAFIAMTASLLTLGRWARGADAVAASAFVSLLVLVFGFSAYEHVRIGLVSESVVPPSVGLGVAALLAALAGSALLRAARSGSEAEGRPRLAALAIAGGVGLLAAMAELHALTPGVQSFGLLLFIPTAVLLVVAGLHPSVAVAAAVAATACAVALFAPAASLLQAASLLTLNVTGGQILQLLAASSVLTALSVRDKGLLSPGWQASLLAGSSRRDGPYAWLAVLHPFGFPVLLAADLFGVSIGQTWLKASVLLIGAAAILLVFARDDRRWREVARAERRSAGLLLFALGLVFGGFATPLEALAVTCVAALLIKPAGDGGDAGVPAASHRSAGPIAEMLGRVALLGLAVLVASSLTTVMLRTTAEPASGNAAAIVRGLSAHLSVLLSDPRTGAIFLAAMMALPARATGALPAAAVAMPAAAVVVAGLSSAAGEQTTWIVLLLASVAAGEILRIETPILRRLAHIAVLGGLVWLASLIPPL